MINKTTKLELIKIAGWENGDKRQHLPYIIKWTCSNCGEKNTWNLNEDYLCYPPIGKTFEEELYCQCNYEGDVVKLKIDFIMEVKE